MERITFLFIFCILQIQPVTAEGLQGTSKGDLESNLSVLNLFGNQPEEVQQIYKSAYGVLSAAENSTFVDVSKNTNFQNLCQKYGVTHLGGPLLGCVTSEEASVWIRTLKPAPVSVEVTIGDSKKTYGPVSSTSESDLTAVVHVTGLKPNTRYPYSVMVEGKPIRIPKDAAIVTTTEATTNGMVRIAFGSCFHRWGIGNKAQADLIRRRNPAAMLLLGDIAVQDRNNHLGLHRADYFLRDLLPAWQDLVATVPVYATWDDHDYFGNDKAGIPPGYSENDKAGVCDVFRQAWNNPTDPQKGVNGQAVSAGGVANTRVGKSYQPFCSDDFQK